jgi:hypothetical protein
MLTGLDDRAIVASGTARDDRRMNRRGKTAMLAATVLLGGAGTAYAAFTTEAGSPYPVGGGAGADPLNLYAGDVSGDGRPDVITMNGTASTVSVFLRQPGGGFAPESGSPIPVTSAPSGVALGDFDGNGLQDLAVSGFGGGAVTLLRRQPGGGFASVQTSVGEVLGGIAAGDFNQDGKLDVAVTETNDNAIRILSGNPSDSTGQTPFILDQTIPASGTGQIAAGDFNGDGHADVAAVQRSGGDVIVALGLGNGRFQPPASVPVGSDPVDIVAADFNRDGHADFAVTNAAPGTVTVMERNAANDGFAAAPGSPVAVSAAPVGITAADFDLDGLTDLAIAANSSAAQVVRNTAGGFVADPAIAMPTVLQNGAAAADFDGDGRPDLAISERNNSTFSVLLNPAPAAPPTPTSTATPTATPTPLPPPVAGKTVNAARKSGTVKFRRPGTSTFVTLAADAQIPVGSTIDTRNGRITLTAAQGKGKTASADFFDGLFKLTQTKGSKPATTLALTEALSCPKAKKASASAAAKKKKTRKLWGSGHGRFTTKGSYSAATVRGTEWLVQDTCTTTTTRVKKGVVAVRDNVKHKTVIVRAGKRYVARRRR